MDVSIHWDEEKLEKLVEEARAARRRVRKVAGVMIVIAFVLSAPIGRAFQAPPSANTTSAAPSPVAAPGVPRPDAPPMPPPSRPQLTRWSHVLLIPMFWLGVGLLCWPSLRPAAQVVLLLGVLLGVFGLVILIAAALHQAPGLTPGAIPASVVVVLLGAVEFHCSLLLHRRSTIFACDYVRGEVADWPVVLGLLSAEGPAYQRLRQQVGLE